MFYNIDTGEILVEDRPEDDINNPGLTIIPGGKINFREGETPEQALIREVGEEFGPEVVVIEHKDLGEILIPQLDGRFILPKMYLITHWEGDIRNIEPEKGVHRWISIDDYETELPLVHSQLLTIKAKAHLNIE